MDRRSWLWRRKSSDKSPGESESSGSASSHSERYSDDQEALRPVSNNASPQHGLSPEISLRIRGDKMQGTETAKSLNEKLALAATLNDSSPQNGQKPEQEVPSNFRCDEVQETVQSLSEKLSAALLNISAKEDLVKQHAKVAEEAVAGWEQAEAEVMALKRLLEAASQKNASLEDQVSHLDEALKECVRQLRQSRDEQEEKIRDAVLKKSHDLELEKHELEKHISELKKQLESTKLEANTMSVQHNLHEKLLAIEKENTKLKVELLAQSKDLKILALERDLSNQAAETASKQHLESVKKIARVEAECRRLHHLTRKTSLANNSRPVANTICVESLTDSQSDSGERMLAVDNEIGNSDSWASALIAELDQFKHGKAGARNVVNNPVEIDLMDDFLEMERLASLPEADHVSSNFETETDSDKAVRNNSSRVETEALQHQVADFQAKIEKIENEKRELEMALVEARNQLDLSCDALTAVENKLVELQMQVDLANESKHSALREVERLGADVNALKSQLELKLEEVEELHVVVSSLEENANGKELELWLELTSAEAAKLHETVASLEEKIESERALSLQHKANADAAEAAKESLEAELQSANMEVMKLHSVVNALEQEADKDKVLREELTAQVEAVKAEAKRTLSAETAKESLEEQLRSANVEVVKLHGVMETLKQEADKEKALREELAAQVEAVKAEAERTLSAETAKKSLELQLQSANSEVEKLCATVNTLESEAEKEKALSAELSMQLEAVESIRKVLASEVESTHQEIQELREKVGPLEAKLKEQTALMEECAVKVEAVESDRKAVECQLEAANLEVVKLTNTVSLLQVKIEQEKLLSEEYEAKCRKLVAQLSRDSREAKLWRLANSNGDLKVKQEKELASAAGKLVECQKTIASLGRHLKSLTNLDAVVSEPEKLEARDVLDFRNGDDVLLSADFPDGLCDFGLPDGNGSCFSPFASVQSPSPPSEMSVFSGGLSSLSSSYRSKTRK